MADGINDEINKLEPKEIREKTEQSTEPTESTLFNDTVTKPSRTRVTRDIDLPTVIDFSQVPALATDALAKPMEQLERNLSAQIAAAVGDKPQFSLPLRPDTLSSFFQGDTKSGMASDARVNIFDAGIYRNPFEAAQVSSPYFRGFNFSKLGESVATLALAGAGAALESTGLVKPDTFKFDGLLNSSDFFKSSKTDQAGKHDQSDSRVASFFSNLGLEQVGKGLSDFFYSSKSSEGEKSADKSEKPATTVLLDNAIESVKRVGNSLIEGADSVLNYLFGSEQSGEKAPEKSDAKSAEKGADQPGSGGEGKKAEGDRPRAYKLPDGTLAYDLKTPDGGQMAVRSTDKQLVVDSSTHGHIEQGRGGPGPHDVQVETTDGRRLHQSPDGTREISNPRSDFKIEEKDGRVEIKDKSGNRVAEFGSLGDARKFLDNGDINLTRPGETVEQAAARLKAGDPKWDSNNHIISDGKGNVLTIDENGNRLRRHPDGRVEMQYKKVDENGNESTVDVRVAQRNGRTIVLLKDADGQFRQTDALTDSQIREQLRGSDLSWHRAHGGLHRRHHHHRSGEDAAPQDTQPVIGEDGKIRPSDHTTVDPVTGDVTARTGNGEVTVRTDSQGQTTISDSQGPPAITRAADGTLSAQGKEPDDKVTFNPETRTLDAWGIEVSPQGTRVHNRDGSSTFVDARGNVELFDQAARSLLRSFENNILFFNGNEIDEDNDFLDRLEEMEEQREREDARQEALHEAALASSLAAAICSASAGVLEPGAVGALLAQIRDAAGMCLALNVPIPGELMVAEAQLQASLPKFNFQVELQNKIYSELGTINGSLIHYALAAGSADVGTDVDYATRLWTGHPRDTATA